MSKVKCNYCGGSGEVTLSNGNMKGHIIRCWSCHGKGEIPLTHILKGLLFEAMIQDSINLRQKLLWTNVKDDLEDAGNLQIRCFEESIDAGLEEDFIIEEYKEHLKTFREWFKIFMMDVQVIYILRQGPGSFQEANLLERTNWIIRNNK